MGKSWSQRLKTTTLQFLETQDQICSCYNFTQILDALYW